MPLKRQPLGICTSIGWRVSEGHSAIVLRLPSILLLLPAAVITFFLAAAAANSISDRLSLWFFDAAFAVFPIGCHYTRSDCSSDGWLHHNWSFLVWPVIAIAFGWLTRHAPLKTRIGGAFLLIIAVMLFMQVLMVLLGWNHFVPTL